MTNLAQPALSALSASPLHALKRKQVQIRSSAMPQLMGGDAPEFRELSGSEALHANVDIDALVGKPFSLAIEMEGASLFQDTSSRVRYISGIVTQASFVRAEERLSVYRVRVVW